MMIEELLQFGVSTGVMIYLIIWMTKRLQNDLGEIKEVLEEIKQELKK